MKYLRITQCLHRLLTADNKPCVLGDGKSTEHLIARFLRHAAACTDNAAEILPCADGHLHVPFTASAAKAAEFARKVNAGLPCVTRKLDATLDRSALLFATFPPRQLRLDSDGNLAVLYPAPSSAPRVAASDCVASVAQRIEPRSDPGATLDCPSVPTAAATPKAAEHRLAAEDANFDLDLKSWHADDVHDFPCTPHDHDDRDRDATDDQIEYSNAERSAQVRSVMTSRWRQSMT